jgi:hypothetical protein
MSPKTGKRLAEVVHGRVSMLSERSRYSDVRYIGMNLDSQVDCKMNPDLSEYIRSKMFLAAHPRIGNMLWYVSVILRKEYSGR